MIEAAPGNGAATSKKEQLAMKHTRTNEARWDEARKRWRIDVQRDGKRRSFYSAIPGRKGKRNVTIKRMSGSKKEGRVEICGAEYY